MERPREAGTLRKPKRPHRSQDRKSKVHKGRGETQRSRVPNRTINCPREASTGKQKHTRCMEGPREAGTLRKQKRSQRSQDRKSKAHKGRGETQRSRVPNRTINCPREARTGKQKHTRCVEGQREAGTLRKQKRPQRSQDRKQKHTRGGGNQRIRDPKRSKCCPREPRT